MALVIWPDDQANFFRAGTLLPEGWVKRQGASWGTRWTPSARASARLPILNLDSGFWIRRARGKDKSCGCARDAAPPAGWAGGPDRFIEGKTGVGVSAVRKSLPVTWPPGNSVLRRRRGLGWREPAAGASVLPSYPAGWEGGNWQAAVASQREPRVRDRPAQQGDELADLSTVNSWRWADSWKGRRAEAKRALLWCIGWPLAAKLSSCGLLGAAHQSHGEAEHDSQASLRRRVPV